MRCSTVGVTGQCLHYRGYDILASLHPKPADRPTSRTCLPWFRRSSGGAGCYKASLKSCWVPVPVREALEDLAMPRSSLAVTRDRCPPFVLGGQLTENGRSTTRPRVRVSLAARLRSPSVAASGLPPAPPCRAPRGARVASFGALPFARPLLPSSPTSHQPWGPAR